MGECTSRPSSEDLAAHSLYLQNINDKHFIEKRIFKVPNIDSGEMQLLLKKFSNLGQIIKLREVFEVEQKKIASCQSVCKTKLQKLHNKKNGLQDSQNKVLVEVIKGRGIPNTNGCSGSRPFVEITVNPLQRTFTTKKEEPFIPK